MQRYPGVEREIWENLPHLGSPIFSIYFIVLWKDLERDRKLKCALYLLQSLYFIFIILHKVFIFKVMRKNRGILRRWVTLLQCVILAVETNRLGILKPGAEMSVKGHCSASGSKWKAEDKWYGGNGSTVPTILRASSIWK